MRFMPKMAASRARNRHIDIRDFLAGGSNNAYHYLATTNLRRQALLPILLSWYLPKYSDLNHLTCYVNYPISS
jgi:hypothetical protein